MRIQALILLLSLSSTIQARDWMGVRKPARKADTATRTAAPAGAAARPASPAPLADTVFLTRRVRTLPVETEGEFLGMLEGMRCFNCTPRTVQVGLSDSLTKDAGFISLRVEVWNLIERPVRDRRVFDHANDCFFFGQKAVDTAMVGGEPAEIRLREKPCYPYLQRVVNRTPAPNPVPAASAPAPADPAKPDSTAAQAAPVPTAAAPED